MLHWKCHSCKILPRWKMLQFMIFFLSPGENKEKLFPVHGIEFFFLERSDKWFCFCFSRKTHEKWLAMFLRFPQNEKLSKQFLFPRENCKTWSENIFKPSKNNFSIKPRKVVRWRNSFAISLLIVKHFSCEAGFDLKAILAFSFMVWHQNRTYFVLLVFSQISFHELK